MKYISAVKALRDRSFYGSTLGMFPKRWHPFVNIVPGVRASGKALDNLIGVAATAISKRLQEQPAHPDFLTHLLEATDGDGRTLGSEELTGEAMTLMTGGTGTTLKYVFVKVSSICSSLILSSQHTYRYHLPPCLKPELPEAPSRGAR